MRYSKIRTLLLAGCAGVALSPAFALAQTQPQARLSYDIPAQDLGAALTQFGQQSEREIVFSADLTRNRKARAVAGEMTSTQALAMLLGDTGLTYRTFANGSIIVEASDPQSGSAAGDGADGTVAALIVTAQKKEEAIQDVPIAISAFTEKTLEEQKIEGGFDLLKAIPNVTFSKNNFTSYNFSIRGIGTKAVSATTDPGVAVAFNNAALIQNRLFEQEYFDVERVEVLRGPQGTLYGRNATAGVINVISAKPNFQDFSGSIKGEVGNYHAKRLVAVINAPLVEEKLAVRFAGSLTNRSGYDFNDTTHHAVNGRDLWSARVTVGFNPTDRLHTSLLWERFNEDDNRSRTGKQLCKRDPGPAFIGSAMVGSPEEPESIDLLRGAIFSQGCKPISLYDEAAFQTPNGFALPFVWSIFLTGNLVRPGYTPAGEPQTILAPTDPYGGLLQSRNLRVINSFRDPIYRAKADIIQLSLSYDLSDSLILSSDTTYDKDSVYSFQDYNRFNTLPIFNDTSSWLDCSITHEAGGCPDIQPSRWRTLAPGGIYCDPQLGCSNTMAGFDISQGKSRQFVQELRLQSNFDGPLNFSVGANYTKFNVVVDYYVMFNALTAFSQLFPFNMQEDITKCNVSATRLNFNLGNHLPVLDINDPAAGCPYIDPNPVEHINGEGHNYFRSKNPYKLQSGAVFGEVYWKISEALKLTAGLRYTDDRKTFTPVPSQLLLGLNPILGGDLNRGLVEKPDIKQHWGEFTGRLGVDWKPELPFTDQTMVYAFYSRGYKGGGANPPPIGYSTRTFAEALGAPPGNPLFDQPALVLLAQNSTRTFKPEFVNAFEVGAKNTLLGGGLIFNADAFFYDYKDYQVSKIVDRTAVNENFDAHVWGLEFETVFSPTRDLRFIGNLGYLDTAIGEGARSIDIMNRTQGNPDWVLIKPWAQFPSNCIAPKAMVEQMLLINGGKPGGDGGNILLACGYSALLAITGHTPIDPATQQPYDATLYPDINGGAGFMQNLKGNELPNSPHWTVNLGGQYGFDFMGGWRATIRADGYWQAQSWARVYNAVNDKLHGWYNANLSLWLERPEDGLKIEIYAKNILDKTPITDSFINSDDTALTTNVFVLDPRLIGLSIKKDF